MPRDGSALPVPVEFVGLARAFRRTVGQSAACFKRDMEELVETITREMNRPRRAANKLRDNIRAEIRRGWLALPNRHRFILYCLDETPRLGRGRLDLHAIRLTTMDTSAADWDNSEPGILLIRTRLSLDRKEVAVTPMPIASLGLHALARRYERGRDRSEAVLLNDLWSIVLTITGVLPGRPDEERGASLSNGRHVWRGACPSGEWRGAIATVHVCNGDKTSDHVIPMIRTFIADG
jgi:hypothetical protein